MMTRCQGAPSHHHTASTTVKTILLSSGVLLIIQGITNKRIESSWSLRISLETVSSSMFHSPPSFQSPLPVGRSNLVPSSFLLQFWPILNKFPNCTFGPSCTILVVDDVVRLPQSIFSFCSQFTTAFVHVLAPQAVIFTFPFPSLTSPKFTAPILTSFP